MQAINAFHSFNQPHQGVHKLLQSVPKLHEYINAPCTSEWQGETAELDHAIVTRIATCMPLFATFHGMQQACMYVRIAPCTVKYNNVHTSNDWCVYTYL